MENKSENIAHNDIFWMSKALKLAKKAEKQGEVPVGAILVVDNKAVSWGYNKKEQWNSPLGHAELITLQRASQKLGRWRLTDATLYVTLEPCLMCAGALVQSRVSRLVFGTKDPKGGAITSLYSVTADERLNHQIPYTEGVLQLECGQILSDFFRKRRKEKK